MKAFIYKSGPNLNSIKVEQDKEGIRLSIAERGFYACINTEDIPEFCARLTNQPVNPNFTEL